MIDLVVHLRTFVVGNIIHYYIVSATDKGHRYESAHIFVIGQNGDSLLTAILRHYFLIYGDYETVKRLKGKGYYRNSRFFSKEAQEQTVTIRILESGLTESVRWESNSFIVDPVNVRQFSALFEYPGHQPYQTFSFGITPNKDLSVSIGEDAFLNVLLYSVTSVIPFLACYDQEKIVSLCRTMVETICQYPEEFGLSVSIASDYDVPILH